MSEVILICGAQGSSKSTLSKPLVEKGYSYLNRDTEGGKIVSLLPKMEAFLKDNKDVVLDNTFPTIEVRKPFIDLAKKYNAKIECLLMGTSIEDCTFNVVQRAIELTGEFPSPEMIKKSKHPNIFPPAVLFKYRKEFQKPTVEEGFAKVDVIKFVRKDDPTFTNRGLFLDFDGTLRNCIGGNGKYPVSKDQIEINPKASKVLKHYRDQGYKLLGVSNQSGVHKGDLTYETAVELFDYTNKLLDVDIEYMFCPHQSAPPICFCRKPSTALFISLMLKHKLSRKDSLMVGDLTSDFTFSKRAGIQYMDQKDFFK